MGALGGALVEALVRALAGLWWGHWGHNSLAYIELLKTIKYTLCLALLLRIEIFRAYSIT